MKARNFCSGSRRIATVALAALIAGWTSNASAAECLGDAANDPTLNCTANDAGVASVTVTQVDDGCDFIGDTFTFDGLLNMSESQASRYDLGFYIGLDSEQAYTGECFVGTIPQGTGTADDGDFCGDFDGEALAVSVANVTATCADTNGDGFFDLALCASWDVNTQSTCSSAAGAIPGNAAKCACTQVETNETVPNCNDEIDPFICPDDTNPCTDTVCLPSGGDLNGCGQSNNTNLCRASAGECDLAENCSGGSCPGDDFSTSLCRASTGVCDPSETCTGTSAACPNNNFSNSVCRASTGVCDPSETCTGSTGACPADILSGGVCRPQNGICDVAESCSGSAGACPADGFVNEGTICRAANGECDIAEECTGGAGACPVNGFVTGGDPCSTDGEICTDDVCDGEGNCDHNDNTVPCDDGLFCTENDACSAGACTGSAVDCGDAIECTDDSCNESSDECENTENNANCDDSNACTTDVCSIEQNGCTSDFICGIDICRSPGYWATHSGYEKDNSINVGQLVIDAAGPLQVCGQTITSTSNLDSPYLDGLGLTSNLEGLCKRTKGVHQRSLYRQLVAAALNCAISGSDCDAILAKYVEVSFSDCSAVCAGDVIADPPSEGECIAQLDCFNNGGQVINGDCVFGTCADQPEINCGGDAGDCPDFNAAPQECVEFEGNCHAAELCNEDLGICPKKTKASSPNACKEARANDCTIDSCN